MAARSADAYSVVFDCGSEALGLTCKLSARRFQKPFRKKSFEKGVAQILEVRIILTRALVGVA